MIAELINICKIYKQPGTNIQNLVLDDITLSVSSNESLAITGPSGSGKSTLLNILGTLDHPTSGIIKLNGTVPDSQNTAALAELRNRYLGFVFQMHHLLPQLTLIENILLPTIPAKDISFKKDAHERALLLLERVGLQSHVYKKPYELSVGECQRAAVVRALINQPRLVLADEPTGSLDAVNADQLTGLLLELKKELQFSMVIVTHSLDLAGRMDKVYKLSSGKLTVER
jgi:lipoprotein-releasing system ATP-binding protein